MDVAFFGEVCFDYFCGQLHPYVFFGWRTADLAFQGSAATRVVI